MIAQSNVLARLTSFMSNWFSRQRFESLSFLFTPINTNSCFRSCKAWPSLHFLRLNYKQVFIQHLFLKILEHQCFPVFYCGLSTCLIPSEGEDDVGLPYHKCWRDGSCSPLTTIHWLVSLPVNDSVRPSFHIYIVSASFFATAHRAERWEMEQRDATAQQETGTNTTHPHTHLYWCTKTTRKPHLFSNLSLPEMLFSLAHNWLFSTFLTCWDLVWHKL